MKKRPKSLKQVFNETYPNQTKNNQKNDYNSQIAHELALYLPDDWQNKVTVKTYENGILYLELASAAHKMRFNSMRLGLLSHLRKTLPELISINDKVSPPKSVHQPQLLTTHVQTSTESKKQRLSVKGRAILTQAKAGLPEELQKALDKLLKD